MGDEPWFTAILDALVADKFMEFVDRFCERECAKFVGASGAAYTLEQTAVHEQYKRLYETRIESHLRKFGISQPQFMNALVLAEANSAAAGAAEAEKLESARQEAASAGIELRAPEPSAPPSLVASLLLVEDFEAFAQMMLQRALEQE